MRAGRGSCGKIVDQALAAASRILSGPQHRRPAPLPTHHAFTARAWQPQLPTQRIIV